MRLSYEEVKDVKVGDVTIIESDLATVTAVRRIARTIVIEAKDAEGNTVADSFGLDDEVTVVRP